jgi:hypothetical protein
MTPIITKENPVTDSEPGPDRQHDAKDARVQVLAAEVRTLVVGSRQVTMSVYNQLDCVPHSEVKPFGRVNPKDADRSEIWVVGRHKTGGALVRARTPCVGDVLDREPFIKASTDVATYVFETIPTCSDEALESVFREVVSAFAWLTHAGFLSRSAVKEALGRTARNAGLPTAGRIEADFQKRLGEVLMGSARTLDGPFESRALSVIRDYEQATKKAQAVVAQVRLVWSELPLIVLAGLR